MYTTPPATTTPDWSLPFFDLTTGTVSQFRVIAASRKIWFEFNGGVVNVTGLVAVGLTWGVGVEVVGTGRVAGVQWGAAELILTQLKAMGEHCGVACNLQVTEGEPPAKQQTLPQYHRTVTAIEGGKLCLRQGLITTPTAATYGNPVTGFVDVLPTILPFIREGGVKGFEVSNEAMSYPHPPTSLDGSSPSNKLHLTFMSDTPARPPPKAPSRPRRATLDSSSTCSNNSLPGACDGYNQ